MAWDWDEQEQHVSEEQWLEEEFDTPEEVAAVFRVQWRLSSLYGFLFLVVTLTIPILHITWDFWKDALVWGGFTLAYFSVHFLYPIFYIMLALAYTVQANHAEDELLGRAASTRRGEH